MGGSKRPPAQNLYGAFPTALEDPGVPCGAALQFQAFSLGTAPGEGGVQVQPGPSCPGTALHQTAHLPSVPASLAGSHSVQGA